MKHNRLAKAAALKGFMDSHSKPKMKNGGVKSKGAKEAIKNAKGNRYQMGGEFMPKKEVNPLQTLLNNTTARSTKPKMQMGGAFNKGLPAPIATEGKDFAKKQSFKKGGMSKKKC